MKRQFHSITAAKWAVLAGFILSCGALLCSATATAQSTSPVAAKQSPSTGPMNLESQQALVNQYCAGCHNDKVKAGGFSWASLDLAHPEKNLEQMEKVIRKLRAGMMPPPNARKPEAATVKAFATAIETRIDQEAALHPYIKPPALHRLNRTEYRNSIRELLDLDVDVSSLLPADPKAGSFDNISDALTVTPALMQGYIRAAEKISREAVGDPRMSPQVAAYSDITQVGKATNQSRWVEGAPFGTRGGLSFIHDFPVDGEYSFKIALAYRIGATTSPLFGNRLPDKLKDQQLEISIDGERVYLLHIDLEMTEERDPDPVTPPIQIKAGQRRVSAVFLSNFDGPVEDEYRVVEQSQLTPGNGEMTAMPQLKNFWITGPLKVTGVSNTPSRNKIFICHPTSGSDEQACATKILSRLAKQAYRRPTTAEDIESLISQYDVGRKDGTFETGIETAIRSMLVNLEFIFRFERIPSTVASGQDYRISDLELASRLSYFLWSSSPDEQLLTLASQNKLRDPLVLEQQVKRMLSDPHSEALTANFADEWLHLRSLDDVIPDSDVFPDFTHNLGHSMKREVELLFQSIMHEDRSVFDLLTANYTFVDEVLAKHYGIPDVIGPRFQRVTLTDPNRFGLLGKGGILVATALPNRTSPVARGKYVLEVLIGTPPPLPPPNVPPLKEPGNFERAMTVRERMEQHRKVEPCRSCHQIMDPIGMALENFDPTGLWRTRDGGSAIDPSGQMYDGTPLSGPVSVRQAVLNHSGAFSRNFTEQLLAYGLGRIVDYQDMPTVRSIAADAAKKNNRFSAYVLGIVKSPSFQRSRNYETTEAARN